MAIKKLIRKVVPYQIRLWLNPLKKHLLHTNYRKRAVYTKSRETLPIQEHMIFYEAYHGGSMTGNAYAVFKYLLSNPKFQHYQHIWAVKTKTVIPPAFKNHPNVTFVIYQSFDYAKYLAISKYLINDTSFPYYFHKRKEQVYANIWHGTPLKTMGLDIKNRAVTAHKNIQKNFLSADYFVSPSTYTTEKLLKSHDVYEIYEGKVLESGYPRVDLMFGADKEALRKQIGIRENKKIILYAPTWRGELQNVEDQSKQLLKDIIYIQEALGKDYTILLKTHYYAYAFLHRSSSGHLVIPNTIDTNELLSIVDILITDYSSIFFDFLPTKKPIIFYANDVEEFVADRGLYISMKKLPGPLCETLDCVIESIHQLNAVQEDYQETYNKFLDAYCKHDDGHATARFIDAVFYGKSASYCYQTTTDKTKILIYGGGFLNNGITSSLISLLNLIDYNEYDITLIDHGTNTKKAKWNNMRKLNKHVHHIFRVGTWNASLADLYRHTLFLQSGNLETAPKQMYQNEFNRMTGLTKFDIGIDFGGYSPFWAAIFAFGNFKKKNIYLHSDMDKETSKKVNNHYPHRQNLKVIFSLYQLFDKVLSVSKLTHKKNRKNLLQYIPKPVGKMDYVINAIDYKHILSMKSKSIQYEFGEDLTSNKTKDNDFSKEMSSEFLHLGTEPPSYPLPQKDDVNFITIGRLSPEKDHEKLLNAFSHIAADKNNIKLYIVGEGALEETIKNIISTLHLTNKVFLTGQLTNPYALLNQCDCFILSSNYEGQAIVLLEALILGKPIITTDSPGPRSVLEGGYGLIVENSVTGLVEGMRRFLNGGKLNNKVFDYESYQEEALNMFYEKVCDLNEQEL
ncbi:CDP-glycerol glycerophosphotransferase family protein [Virgibacillus soli]